jgi:hypothetical protein
MFQEKWLLCELCLAAAALLLFFSAFACSRETMDPAEARRVLNDFYTDRVPEPINDRHLVNAGKPIVPYLLVEIENRDMPKRRYAIGALEKIKDRRALPLLIQILEDRTELSYFREDAFRAIWHIDRKLGEEYAQKSSAESQDMDRIIELLKEGKI